MTAEEADDRIWEDSRPKMRKTDLKIRLEVEKRILPDADIIIRREADERATQ